MRCEPPPTTTGWRVCGDGVDAGAAGGGRARVQVCKGEGELVVERRGDKEKAGGTGGRAGACVPGGRS